MVEEEGADSVSLINTLLGMAIDIREHEAFFIYYNGRAFRACC